MMAKKADTSDRTLAMEALQRSVLTEGSEQYEWPIAVEYLGQTAHLRLETGKRRILIDWVVPDDLSSSDSRKRIKHQIPHEPGTTRETDPGHSVDRAITWTRDFIRREVSVRLNGKHLVSAHGTTKASELRVVELFRRFIDSEAWKDLSPERRRQFRCWMDFVVQAALNERWLVAELDLEALRRIVRKYQEPWRRRLEDGTSRKMGAAGHNTAIRSVKMLRQICRWGECTKVGPNRYLLRINPFARMEMGTLTHERPELSKSRDAASDRFVAAMRYHLDDLGKSGQFRMIFRTEELLGRRPGETRQLAREDYLTSEAEIAQALRDQGCRKILRSKHLSDDDVDEAARRYAACGGALRFRWNTTKQGNLRRGNPLQYDRVVPLPAPLAAEYERYVNDHWAPLGLPRTAPLFPAATDLANPTPKDTVMTWWQRTVAAVQERHPDITIPKGRTHTLRHRFREKVDKTLPDRIAAFIAGWTLRPPGAMNLYYQPVDWRDILEAIEWIGQNLV